MPAPADKTDAVSRTEALNRSANALNQAEVSLNSDGTAKTGKPTKASLWLSVAAEWRLLAGTIGG